MSEDWLTRVAALRREYAGRPLDEAAVAPTWLEQFRAWLDDAIEAGALEPNAMVVATADGDGRPGARTVLLKGVDERGFAFFTNLESAKGREVAENPRAALVFPWLDLARQVVVSGDVTEVEAGEADAYWAGRPTAARISALASPQSRAIASRDELLARRARAEAVGEAARPAHWGGLRVAPRSVEFWQGRPDRLHDRIRYRRDDDGGGAEGGWIVERLAP
ncbi:MAG: pyridoxamine 5-phosphate oxidase [Solirubrobacteraceae bacterium]|jgi:pyridoxamine 5'-phosphate oxidase|nr:pyridoxamine 5-phosphate oxidase [Solirubrobacteraceae bacterium]